MPNNRFNPFRPGFPCAVSLQGYAVRWLQQQGAATLAEISVPMEGGSPIH